MRHQYIQLPCPSKSKQSAGRTSTEYIELQREEIRNGRKIETENYYRGKNFISETVLMKDKNLYCKMRLDYIKLTSMSYTYKEIYF